MVFSRFWATTAPFYLLAIIAVFLVKNNVFFWDAIQLGAKQATWFYENDFRYLILPQEIDSGHPPLFGIYLAAVWKLFGRSLVASHWAMLPFLLGIIFFAGRLARHLTAQPAGPAWLLPLLVVDPTLAAQSVLVSPDIVLVVALLAALHGILSERDWLKTVGAIVLALISTRGMMVVTALYLFEVWRTYLRGAAAPRRALPIALYKKALPYIPAGLLAATFLGYHYLQTGWIGYHADSPWAPTFEPVDARGFLFNIGILGWRLVDYGRIFVWIALGYLLWHRWNTKGFSYLLWQLLGLTLLLLLILSPSLLLHKYLLNHRYLLPVFLALTLLFFTLLQRSELPPGRRNLLYALVLVGLLSGNRWIYPRQIAQGWDATLAHLPHYELRQQLLEYLDSAAISYQLVGTAFPEIGPFDYRDLSGRQTGFAPKDLSAQAYIYYSNIMNDFSDEELAALDRQWTVVVRYDRRGVCAILYRRQEVGRK